MGTCQPFIIGTDHQGGSDQLTSIQQPPTTIVTKQKHALAQPYLIKFYGNNDAASIEQPLDTVTTNDRFGLCRPGESRSKSTASLPGGHPFSHLNPSELAAAQGFPRSYKFTGSTTEVIKQIGNAVPKNLAKALGKSAIQCL